MAGSPPLQPGSETQLDGWGHVGAPKGLQLPLSLEQGGGSCHQGKLSWDVGGGEEQRAEKEAESGGESPRGRGLGETTQPRFSPSTQEQKDAKTGASWAHWPADPPFLFAGGWAVTQGGSQWERRRWLYQLMLKKTRGSCLHSHPSGPLHLQPLSTSSSVLAHILTLTPRCPGPSAAQTPLPLQPGIAHIDPIWVLGATQSMTGPARPPPATTPWRLGYLP